MTIDQLLANENARRDYCRKIREKLQPAQHPTFETANELYQEIPEEIRTGFIHSELLRLKLNQQDTTAKLNPLYEFDHPYPSRRAVLPGRPYPLTRLHYRSKENFINEKSILLNWIQSFCVHLDKHKRTTLDIYYGQKDLVPPNGKYIGSFGIQTNQNGLTTGPAHRIPAETEIYLLKPIGRTGYYSVANRNFSEDRPLPHSCHFQRYIVGPTTQQSILRAATYLAKLTNHTDTQTIQTLYRRLFNHSLYAMAGTPAFASTLLQREIVNRLTPKRHSDLDDSPTYHNQLLNFTNPVKKLHTLNDCTAVISIPRADPLITIKLLPNLLEPYHTHSLIVSLQSLDTNSATVHATTLRKAVQSLLTE